MIIHDDLSFSYSWGSWRVHYTHFYLSVWSDKCLLCPFVTCSHTQGQRSWSYHERFDWIKIVILMYCYTAYMSARSQILRRLLNICSPFTCWLLINNGFEMRQVERHLILLPTYLPEFCQGIKNVTMFPISYFTLFGLSKVPSYSSLYVLWGKLLFLL